MVAFLILASDREIYSSLFSCCCLSRGGNKFSIKFGRYFMDCKFLHFLCFDVKIKAKNSNNPPEKKFPVGILPWLQFD